MIAKRHMTHKTTGPDAPLNSKPSALNSTGPVAYLKNSTTQIEAIAASGNPMQPPSDEGRDEPVCSFIRARAAYLETSRIVQ